MNGFLTMISKKVLSTYDVLGHLRCCRVYILEVIMEYMRITAGLKADEMA